MFRTVLTLFSQHATQLSEGGNPEANTSKDAEIITNKQLLWRQATILVEWSKSVCFEAAQPPEACPDARRRELLKRRLDDVASTAMSKFYAYQYNKLPVDWRDMYAESLVLMAHLRLLEAADSPGEAIEGSTMDEIVALLDRVIIMTCSGRSEPSSRYEKMLIALEDFWTATRPSEPESGRDQQDPIEKMQNDRQAKRRKVGESMWDPFPIDEPLGRPAIDPRNRCPVVSGWSMDDFESMMNSTSAHPTPLVFTDLMTGWPALAEHPWRSTKYLLSKTFGGRRLVPVEIGRSYVDDGWGQELVRFRDFLDQYILRDGPPQSGGHSGDEKPVGYLAQHNLFEQIPSLRSDVLVPDYCWTHVPPHPHDPRKNQPALGVPQLNAWFGPARTITPLHTDGYHNLLCQAVGTKYVRLYAPGFTQDLMPRDYENGIDMSNTSLLDVGVLEGWDEPPEGMDSDVLSRERQRVKDIPYWECVLKEGDTLLIPMGWWHYVRSLSVSFSVSFWWN